MRKSLLARLVALFIATMTLSGCIFPYWGYYDDRGGGGRHHDRGGHRDHGDRHRR